MTTFNVGGITFENRPYTPGELMHVLRIPNRMQFWRAFERANPRPVLELGPKTTIILPEAVIAFVKFFMISKETEAADRRRLADARRTS